MTKDYSVKNFLIRRTLRIFPLYYLVIALSFLLLPIIARLISKDIHLPSNVYFYLFFLPNYDQTKR